jgi:DNA-binding MarR family transcriptional regulator
MRMDETTEAKKETQEVKHRQYGDLEWTERVPLFGPDSSSRPPCDSAIVRGELSGPAKLARDSEDMLIKAYRKPMVLTELYKELGLSGYKAGKAKEELLRAGLVYEVALPTNRRGRQKKLLQVTPKGTEFLRRLGIEQRGRGRGGVKHLYYQKMLKVWYEEHGYTVEIEATTGGTCFDLLVIRKDRERLGIEIALSQHQRYEEVNARKAMESGLEHVLFVCETEELMERLRKKLSPLIEIWPGNKPGFKLIGDYLRDD